MKIINISSFGIFPPNTGGARLVFGFLKYFAKDHQVVLITVKSEDKSKNELSSEGVDIIDSLPINSIIKFLSPMTFAKLVKNTIKHHPDYLIVDCPWFGIYGFLIQRLYGIPYIIHEHNIEYIRFKRLGKWWWPILKQYEKFVYKYAYKILCISPIDREILINKINVNSEKILDCPYGIDMEIFKSNPSKKIEIRKRLNLDNEPFILFFGTLNYLPNIEAIKIIKNEIIPKVKKEILNAKFIIAGKNPPMDIKDENIIFTGMVPKIEDYINACDFVIVPLLSGGGIRTRIIESIACGKIVISTSLGAEGIERDVCEDRLIIANGWNRFAEEIVNSIKNSPKDQIPKKFIEKYNWKNITSNLKLD